MDSQLNDGGTPTNNNNTDSDGYVFDMNDTCSTNLISDCVLKEKTSHCRCSTLRVNVQNSQPWITFIHILCTVRKCFSYIISIKVIYLIIVCFINNYQVFYIYIYIFTGNIGFMRHIFDI